MTVTVLRHKRRRRPAFFLTAEGIELRVPYKMSQRVIDTILKEHEKWIKEKLHSFPKREPIQDHLLYRGQSIPLVRLSCQTFEFKDEYFHCPIEWSELEIRSSYESWLREQALQEVRKRATYYEGLLGVKASGIRIGNQKTRWGSCSSKGNISINVRLMLAPPEVMDYVIAHEWAHLVHFDHSKSFWGTVESVYPNMVKAMDWLKQNGHLLRV